MNKELEDLFTKQEEALTANLKHLVELRNKSVTEQMNTNDQLIELLLGVIEVIDSYEKAEEVIKERALIKDENGKKIMERFANVHKRLHRLLLKYHVEKMEFPDNKLRIGFSRVLETRTDPNSENDTIIEVVKNGYLLDDNLIREAEVIIVKN